MFLVIMLTNLILVNAQTDTVMYISEMHGEWHYICFNQHERDIVYAPNGCNNINWLINYSQSSTENPIILDGNFSSSYAIEFGGANCGQYSSHIIFVQPTTPEEATTILWKHQYETITLEAVGADSVDMYTYFWPHNGATTPTVEVASHGNYQCLISDMCATATRSFIVKDNVEIYRATVDLATGLNKVTWQTTPEQAESCSLEKHRLTQ